MLESTSSKIIAGAIAGVVGGAAIGYGSRTWQMRLSKLSKKQAKSLVENYERFTKTNDVAKLDENLKELRKYDLKDKALEIVSDLEQVVYVAKNKSEIKDVERVNNLGLNAFTKLNEIAEGKKK